MVEQTSLLRVLTPLRKMDVSLDTAISVLDLVGQTPKQNRQVMVDKILKIANQCKTEEELVEKIQGIR